MTGERGGEGGMGFKGRKLKIGNRKERGDGRKGSRNWDMEKRRSLKAVGKELGMKSEGGRKTWRGWEWGMREGKRRGRKGRSG